MKLIILTISMFILSSVYAGEVDTECVAMNENREKIIKTSKPQDNSKKGSSSQ